MRKPFILVCLLLISTLLFGCTSQGSPKNENEKQNTTKTPVAEQLAIKDYFPIRENVRYVYEGSGNEYASYDVHIDYTSDNRVQRRVNNGGTVMAEVIALKDGKLTKLVAKEEAYYRENLLQTPDYESMILQSIVNTFGKYYGSDKVVLTIDGKPYESGHIAFQKGDYLPVNYENSVKIAN